MSNSNLFTRMLESPEDFSEWRNDLYETLRTCARKKDNETIVRLYVFYLIDTLTISQMSTNSNQIILSSGSLTYRYFTTNNISRSNFIEQMSVQEMRNIIIDKADKFEDWLSVVFPGNTYFDDEKNYTHFGEYMIIGLIDRIEYAWPMVLSAITNRYFGKTEYDLEASYRYLNFGSAVYNLVTMKPVSVGAYPFNHVICCETPKEIDGAIFKPKAVVECIVSKLIEYQTYINNDFLEVDEKDPDYLTWEELANEFVKYLYNRYRCRWSDTTINIAETVDDFIKTYDEENFEHEEDEDDDLDITDEDDEEETVSNHPINTKPLNDDDDDDDEEDIKDYHRNEEKKNKDKSKRGLIW